MSYNTYYGVGPYQGQPPFPPSSYPANPNYPPAPPTQLQPNSVATPSYHIASLQSAYEQNRSVIPGLAFGTPANDGPKAWQQPPQPSQRQPPHEPNLVPASRYYQSRGALSNGALAKRNGQTGSAMKDQPPGDTAEEGELSEGEYDDLYEPAASNHRHDQESDGYKPGEHAWYDGTVELRDATAKAAAPVDAPTANRDSYSPYLSPHEIQPALKPGASRTVPAIDLSRQPVASRITGPVPTGPSADALSDAKRKARAAILGLWPLDVRYADFVNEGIDKDIVRVLFNDLGLDTASVSSSASEVRPGPHIPGLTPSIQRIEAGQYDDQNPDPQAGRPSPAANSSASQVATSAAGKAEERKDRIARLLAAKQALSGASSAATPMVPAAVEGTDDKQLKLQQKMEALQKSREARAQKAASRKSSVAAQPSPPTTSHGLPSVPPPPSGGTSTPNHPLPAKVDIPAPDSARSVIPGLFLSSNSQPAPPSINQRKRPVAADFDDYAHTNSQKRPLGPSRQSKLVIDVSEGSDDDVEMEIGSGDESTNNVQTTDTPSRRTTSFRDLPPLSDATNQRQFSNPGPARVATPPGHLAVMDKQIEAMKRKIALAEARKKLKSAMSGGNGHAAASSKSSIPTPDAAMDSDTAMPSLRRVQSMDPSSGLDGDTARSSPAAHETGSIKLPKNSDIAKAGVVDRAQRVRVLSQSLPGMQSRLQAKKTKLRLLQSQMSRLEKEIEQEDADRQVAEEELHGLQELVTPENAVSHAPTSDVPEPETAQQGLDDAQIAQQLASTIADKSTDTGPVGVSSSAPASVHEENSVRAIDTSGNSESDALADARADLPALSEEASVIGEAVSSPQQSTPASELVAVGTPSPVASNDNASGSTEASHMPSPVVATSTADLLDAEQDSPEGLEEVEMELDASDSGEADDTVVVMHDDDVLPLIGQSPGLKSPTRDVADEASLPAQISVGVNDSDPDEGLNNDTREVRPTRQEGRPSSERGFTPYESPFQLFRNYRYHHDYQTAVAGGLRSLTYSNKIDPNLPVCPDQLEGRLCPKGSECEYQHFESMKLPDDQILLQLGGTNIEGPERVQYNNGLRELLQDMRQRNIKDFPSIAQGIVDYHNRFTGDPSRILTLGDVLI